MTETTIKNSEVAKPSYDRKVTFWLAPTPEYAELMLKGIGKAAEAGHQVGVRAVQGEELAEFLGRHESVQSNPVLSLIEDRRAQAVTSTQRITSAFDGAIRAGRVPVLEVSFASDLRDPTAEQTAMDEAIATEVEASYPNGGIATQPVLLMSRTETQE